MTRTLSASERTRPAHGDLSEFDEDARHRRWIEARFCGVDPRFCDVLDRVAPQADLSEVVRAVFGAHRAAERVVVAATRFRGPAAATAARHRKSLDLAIELLRPADVDHEHAIADEAIGEIVGALRGLAAPQLALDRSRLVTALIAERGRFDEAARLLDGRGRPQSRLRAFADQLLPIFARHADPDRRERGDLRDFIVEAARLVTGSAPSTALASRIARELLK